MIVLIFDDKSVKVEEKKKEEKKLPKYIVPTSNFDEGYISGIPCKVVSEKPYKKMRKHFNSESEDDVIDVVSLLTGIKYTIPNDWYNGYDDIFEAVAKSKLPLHTLDGNKKSLIGKTYYVRDNSWITDFEGNHGSLIGLPCKVVSVPFKGIVNPCGKDIVRTFILVENNGKIYRTLFGEWNFYPQNVVNKFGN